MLLVWFVVVVVAAGALRIGIHQGRMQQQAQFAADTELVADLLGDFVDDQVRLLEQRATLLLDGATVQSQTLRGIGVGSGLEATAVFDADGRFMANSLGDESRVGEDSTLVLDHLRQAVANGAPAVSDVIISPALSVPAIALVSPYETPFGTRHIVGVITVNANTILRQLVTGRSIGADRVEVIDGNSRLIASSGTDLPNELLSLGDRYPALADAMDQADSDGVEYTGPDGAVYHAQVAEVPQTGWRLIASAPTDRLYYGWSDAAFVAGAAVLVLLVVLGLAAVLFIAAGRRRQRAAAEVARSTEAQLQAAIRDRARAEAEAQQLSMTDDLTGLLNRRGFMVQVTHALGRESRRPSSVLLFIDVDRLKQVNDNFGHHRGDALLVAVADVLRGVFRDHDLLARLGGDEFAVFVPRWDDDPELIVDRLSQSLERRNQEGDLPTPISLSIGLATTRNGGHQGVDDLIRTADAAMYVQKEKRRRAVALDDGAPSAGDA